MAEIEVLSVTWKRSIAVWWAFIWRYAAIGLIGGILFGFLFSDKTWFSFLLLCILGLITGLVTTRVILKKEYSGFGLKILDKNNNVLPLSWKHTTIIWWAHTWRWFVLYAGLATIIQVLQQHHPLNKTGFMIIDIGLLLCLCWQIFHFSILNRNFRTFKLAIVQ